MLDTAPTASKAQGWNNATNAASTVQYSYDANGNMTSDPYKGLAITYNFLNLPTQMQFGNSFTGTKTIDVLYDASGRKLRKTVTDGTTLQYRQDYVGGIEYRSTSTVSLSLESIYHPEGRVFNTNTGTTSADALRYEYSIKDHLGNTRLNFTDKDGDGKVAVTTTTTNEILSESHYYPFGLAMSGPWMDDAAARDNQYKYNGKELNEDFGLGWYDYGARWYDASLGRWNVVDNLTQEYSAWSGYNYVMGNPVKYVDPDGQGVKISIERDESGSITSVTASADIYVYSEDGDTSIDTDAYASSLQKDLDEQYNNQVFCGGNSGADVKFNFKVHNLKNYSGAKAKYKELTTRLTKTGLQQRKDLDYDQNFFILNTITDEQASDAKEHYTTGSASYGSFGTISVATSKNSSVSHEMGHLMGYWDINFPDHPTHSGTGIMSITGTNRRVNQNDVDIFNFGAGFLGVPATTVDRGALTQDNRGKHKFVGNSASGNNSPIKGPFSSGWQALKVINGIQ